MKASFSKNDVEAIQFSDVMPIVKEAKKHRVTFHNPAGAEWYGIKHDGEVIAVYCLVCNGKSARFKSNYTKEKYRRNGSLSAFIEHSKEECEKRGLKKMTVFCTPMSLGSHLKNGAVPKWERNGITFVVYDMR